MPLLTLTRIKSAARLAVTLTLGAFAGSTIAAPAAPTSTSQTKPPASLKLAVYNPGSSSAVAVSSSLFSSAHQVLLVDAQFQQNDAQALVDRLKAGDKTLTTIYISHAEPDFYFGLDVLKAAFPQVKIIASAPTVAAIKASNKAKLAHWGPILKEQAPKTLIVPDAVNGNSFELEGNKIEIHGLNGGSPPGSTPSRSYLWLPGIRTIAGGALLDANEHVWLTDTPSHADRLNWLKTLDEMLALKPGIVVPGHYQGDIAYNNIDSIRFTREYIQAFDTAAAKAKNAKELIDTMRVRYPKLTNTNTLEMSANASKNAGSAPVK